MPHMRWLVLPVSLCLALAVALGGVPARAAGPTPGASPRSQPQAAPRVLLWPPVARDDARAIESALAGDGWQVVPQGPIAQRLQDARARVGAADDARLVAVEAGLVRAQDLYLAQRWDDLIAALQALQAEAIDALARPEGCAALWELEFRLGLAHGARKAAGDEAAQAEHYALALALDPERRPLGELYGPDVTAAFLRAVDAATTRIPRAVDIHRTPDDAVLFVDCREVAPEQAPTIAAGRHAIRAVAAGRRPHAAIVEIAASEPIAIDLPPDDTADPIERLAATWPESLPQSGASARAIVDAVARQAGASHIVALRPGRTGTRAELWADGRRLAVVERPGDADAALGAMATLRDEPRSAPPATAPTRDEPPRKPLVRRWWFWTVLGGSATALGLGLGLGLGLPDRSPDTLRLVVR